MRWGSCRAHKQLWSLPCLAIGVIALSIGSAMAPAVAHAQLGTLGTPAGFQIDAQLYSGPTGDDWAQGSSFSGIFIGASRTPSILPSVSFRDANWAASASDPTSFAGSSNKNSDYIGATQSPWSTSPGSGPQKNDFTDIYVTSRIEFVPGPPATTNVWLIVGGTTRAVNGDSHVDFEFNRAGVTLVPNKPDHLVGQGPYGGRSIGDVIVSVDYGTGGTSPSISIRRWQEVVPATVPPSYTWVDVTPASAGTHYMAVDNVGVPTGPWGGIAPDGSSIAAGSNMVALQFFEGAVNLTAAGVVPTDLCSAVSTMTVKSRSSTSFTAELKDYSLVPFSIVTSPTCSISGPGNLCAATLGATYSVTTDTPSPSYLWSITGNGTINGSATGSSVVVDAGASGTFNLAVNITAGAGGVCGTSCNKSVTVNPNPTVTVANVTVCASAVPATMTAVGAGGTGPYTYSWSGPGGFTGSGASISVSTAGTYNVTVTDNSTTHCTGTGSGLLTLNPNPTVTVAPVAVCASAVPATLTAVGAGGTGPYTYSWSGPGGFTGTGASISASTAGPYNVTVTDASSTHCTGTGSGNLTLNPNPTVTVAPVAVCAGALPATLTAVGAGGTGPYTYSWTGPGGFTGTGASISVSTEGPYNVTVTDASSTACTGTGSGNLTINPNITVSVPSKTICASAVPTTLTASPSGAQYSYSWSGPSGFTGTGNPISVSTAGTYNVTVTETATQCAGTGSGDLTLNPNPTVTVAPVAVCASAVPTNLTAVGSGGTGPYTFSWSGPSGFTATGNPISVSTAGTYNVTVTDASSTSCTGTGQGSLTLNPNPTVTVPPVAVCAAALPTNLTAVPSGGTGPYTFSWSGPGGFTATGNPISVSTVGTYNVTVTDASSTQCTGTGQGTLSLNPNPDVTATGDALSCFKSCGQVSASSLTPNVTFSWTGPNGFTSTQQNPAVCDSGNYTVTATSSLGCTNTATAHVSIVIPTIAPCGSGGPITDGFELDGDAFATSPNPPGDDWDLVLAGNSGATLTTGVVNDFSSKADDYFQIGTKDQDDITSWRYNIQAVPDKDDILHGGAAQYGGLLYFFGDRYDVSGDAQIGFWFLKDTLNIVVPGSTFTGHHTVGDLLILSNFVKGGGTPVIFAYEWVGSGGSDGALNKLTLSASNSFATVNSTSKPSPWPFQAKGKGAANQFPAGSFFEGGIDLGCLTGAGVSGCFSNFILETRSSASVTASLKDFLIGRFSADGSSIVASLPNAAGQLQEASRPMATALPIKFALNRALPNPFTGTTVISYALPEASTVSLKVFNVQGQQVATLVSGKEDPGYHSMSWNARGRSGLPAPAGIYFYRLEATGLNTGAVHQQTRKMLLLK